MISLSPDIPEQARDWRNQPSIIRWCRENELLSEADQADWLEWIKRSPSVKMLGIYDDGKAIGVCGLTSLSMIHRHAEFSLYIAPEHQGNGYGEKALIQLLHYGFSNIGLHRIWGEVFEENPALEMFQRIGFFIEGRHRDSYFKNGKFIDSKTIAILRDEFYNRNNDQFDHNDSMPSSIS